MSKIAQVATGKQTCQKCGKTKPFEDFQLSRWGRPIASCRECHRVAIARGRKAGAKRRRDLREAEAQAEIAAANADAASRADAVATTPTGATIMEFRVRPGDDVALRLTRIAGQVRGAALLDDRLAPLADELDDLVNDVTGSNR